MTAEIVNLRQYRKQKAQAIKDKKSSENRATHGRSKSARAKEAHQNDQAERKIDGTYLRPDEQAPDTD